NTTAEGHAVVVGHGGAGRLAESGLAGPGVVGVEGIGVLAVTDAQYGELRQLVNHTELRKVVENGVGQTARPVLAHIVAGALHFERAGAQFRDRGLRISRLHRVGEGIAVGIVEAARPSTVEALGQTLLPFPAEAEADAQPVRDAPVVLNPRAVPRHRPEPAV